MLHTASGEPVNSGPNAWLFVLRDSTIFATDKKTDPPRYVFFFSFFLFLLCQVCCTSIWRVGVQMCAALPAGWACLFVILIGGSYTLALGWFCVIFQREQTSSRMSLRALSSGYPDKPQLDIFSAYAPYVQVYIFAVPLHGIDPRPPLSFLLRRVLSGSTTLAFSGVGTWRRPVCWWPRMGCW